MNIEFIHIWYDFSKEVVHLGAVACEDRLEEALVMFKSAVLLTRKSLHFHIFADDNLRPQFDETVSNDTNNIMLYHICIIKIKLCVL